MKKNVIAISVLAVIACMIILPTLAATRGTYSAWIDWSPPHNTMARAAVSITSAVSSSPFAWCSVRSNTGEGSQATIESIGTDYGEWLTPSLGGKLPLAYIYNQGMNDE